MAPGENEFHTPSVGGGGSGGGRRKVKKVKKKTSSAYEISANVADGEAFIVAERLNFLVLSSLLTGFNESHEPPYAQANITT